MIKFEFRKRQIYMKKIQKINEQQMTISKYVKIIIIIRKQPYSNLRLKIELRILN